MSGSRQAPGGVGPGGPSTSHLGGPSQANHASDADLRALSEVVSAALRQKLKGPASGPSAVVSQATQRYDFIVRQLKTGKDAVLRRLFAALVRAGVGDVAKAPALFDSLTSALLLVRWSPEDPSKSSSLDLGKVAASIRQQQQGSDVSSVATSAASSLAAPGVGTITTIETAKYYCDLLCSLVSCNPVYLSSVFRALVRTLVGLQAAGDLDADAEADADADTSNGGDGLDNDDDDDDSDSVLLVDEESEEEDGLTEAGMAAAISSSRQGQQRVHRTSRSEKRLVRKLAQLEARRREAREAALSARACEAPFCCLVYDSLARVLSFAPTSAGLLHSLLLDHYPHQRLSSKLHSSYARHLLHVGEAIPRLRDRLLATLVIEKVTEMDASIDTALLERKARAVQKQQAKRDEAAQDEVRADRDLAQEGSQDRRLGASSKPQIEIEGGQDRDGASRAEQAGVESSTPSSPSRGKGFADASTSGGVSDRADPKNSSTGPSSSGSSNGSSDIVASNVMAVELQREEKRRHKKDRVDKKKKKDKRTAECDDSAVEDDSRRPDLSVPEGETRTVEAVGEEENDDDLLPVSDTDLKAVSESAGKLDALFVLLLRYIRAGLGAGRSDNTVSKDKERALLQDAAPHTPSDPAFSALVSPHLLFYSWRRFSLLETALARTSEEVLMQRRQQEGSEGLSQVFSAIGGAISTDGGKVVSLGWDDQQKQHLFDLLLALFERSVISQSTGSSSSSTSSLSGGDHAQTESASASCNGKAKRKAASAGGSNTGGKPKFAQFLLFYACAQHPPFADVLISRLLHRIAAAAPPSLVRQASTADPSSISSTSSLAMETDSSAENRASSPSSKSGLGSSSLGNVSSLLNGNAAVLTGDYKSAVACSAYLGSLLARGAFIPLPTLFSALYYLAQYAHGYSALARLIGEREAAIQQLLSVREQVPNARLIWQPEGDALGEALAAVVTSSPSSSSSGASSFRHAVVLKKEKEPSADGQVNDDSAATGSTVSFTIEPGEDPAVVIPQIPASLPHVSIFIAVVQAICYALCFNASSIYQHAAASEDGVEEAGEAESPSAVMTREDVLTSLSALDLGSLVCCELDPLRGMSETVAREFVRVGLGLGLLTQAQVRKSAVCCHLTDGALSARDLADDDEEEAADEDQGLSSRQDEHTGRLSIEEPHSMMLDGPSSLRGPTSHRGPAGSVVTVANTASTLTVQEGSRLQGSRVARVAGGVNTTGEDSGAGEGGAVSDDGITMAAAPSSLRVRGGRKGSHSSSPSASVAAGEAAEERRRQAYEQLRQVINVAAAASGGSGIDPYLPVDGADEAREHVETKGKKMRKAASVMSSSNCLSFFGAPPAEYPSLAFLVNRYYAAMGLVGSEGSWFREALSFFPFDPLLLRQSSRLFVTTTAVSEPLNGDGDKGEDCSRPRVLPPALYRTWEGLITTDDGDEQLDGHNIGDEAHASQDPQEPAEAAGSEMVVDDEGSDTARGADNLASVELGGKLKASGSTVLAAKAGNKQAKRRKATNAAEGKQAAEELGQEDETPHGGVDLSASLTARMLRGVAPLPVPPSVVAASGGDAEDGIGSENDEVGQSEGKRGKGAKGKARANGKADKKARKSKAKEALEGAAAADEALIAAATAEAAFGTAAASTSIWDQMEVLKKKKKQVGAQPAARATGDGSSGDEDDASGDKRKGSNSRSRAGSIHGLAFERRTTSTGSGGGGGGGSNGAVLSAVLPASSAASRGLSPRFGATGPSASTALGFLGLGVAPLLPVPAGSASSSNRQRGNSFSLPSAALGHASGPSATSRRAGAAGNPAASGFPSPLLGAMPTPAASLLAFGGVGLALGAPANVPPAEVPSSATGPAATGLHAAMSRLDALVHNSATQSRYDRLVAAGMSAAVTSATAATSSTGANDADRRRSSAASSSSSQAAASSSSSVLAASAPPLKDGAEAIVSLLEREEAQEAAAAMKAKGVISSPQRLTLPSASSPVSSLPSAASVAAAAAAKQRAMNGQVPTSLSSLLVPSAPHPSNSPLSHLGQRMDANLTLATSASNGNLLLLNSSLAPQGGGNGNSSTEDNSNGSAGADEDEDERLILSSSNILMRAAPSHPPASLNAAALSQQHQQASSPSSTLSSSSAPALAGAGSLLLGPLKKRAVPGTGAAQPAGQAQASLPPRLAAAVEAARGATGTAIASAPAATAPAAGAAAPATAPPWDVFTSLMNQAADRLAAASSSSSGPGAPAASAGTVAHHSAPFRTAASSAAPPPLSMALVDLDDSDLDAEEEEGSRRRRALLEQQQPRPVDKHAGPQKAKEEPASAMDREASVKASKSKAAGGARPYAAGKLHEEDDEDRDGAGSIDAHSIASSTRSSARLLAGKRETLKLKAATAGSSKASSVRSSKAGASTELPPIPAPLAKSSRAQGAGATALASAAADMAPASSKGKGAGSKRKASEAIGDNDGNEGAPATKVTKEKAEAASRPPKKKRARKETDSDDD